MPSQYSDKIAEGLDYIRDIVRETGILEIAKIHHFGQLRPYYIVFEHDSKYIDLCLNRNYLMDLTHAAGFMRTLKGHIRTLEHRIKNENPYGFYCLSGIPCSIEITWPLEKVQNAAASWCDIRATSSMNPEDTIPFALTITSQQFSFDLGKDAVEQEMAIFNTVRKYLDKEGFSLSKRVASSRERIGIDLDLSPSVPTEIGQVLEFLKGKVFWLGYKSGDRTSSVYISDPWDAEYLGVTTNALVQAAQVLEAQGMLELNAAQDFATVGPDFLKLVPQYEATARKINPKKGKESGESSQETKWDCFISHASEDKESFVKELADALTTEGLSVWYDEFSLSIGKSLRRSIDEGLLHSRFGIVVLSPSFFQKEWPQKELDGLVALELDGRRVVLPLWHEVTVEEVRRYSPVLADRVAVSTSEGMSEVVKRLIRAMS